MRSSRLVTCMIAGVTLIAGGTAARATVLEDFPNFSNTSGLTLVGDTSVATTSDGSVLRLVPANYSEAGAAYSQTPITLGSNDTFSTSFQFRMTDAGGTDPADGFTFVLAASPNGLGGSGSGLGYAGVGNSVAISFDTFNNNTTGLNDGNSSNHVGILTDGNANVVASNNPYNVNPCEFTSGPGFPNNHNGGAGSFGCLSNGDLWSASISYNGSQLSVEVQDGSAAVWDSYTNYSIDIASLLGSNTAYAGFTSSTGSGYQNTDLLDWNLADTTQFDTPSVPEPTALVVFLAGLAALGLLRLRRS